MFIQFSTYDKGNFALCIPHHGSHETAPPTFNHAEASQSGNLVINIPGKAASVNLMCDVKRRLSGTTKGSGRKLRTTVFF